MTMPLQVGSSLLWCGFAHSCEAATAVSNKNKMEQLFSLGAFEFLKRSFVLISNQADILSANFPVRCSVFVVFQVLKRSNCDRKLRVLLKASLPSE